MLRLLFTTMLFIMMMNIYQDSIVYAKNEVGDPELSQPESNREVVLYRVFERELLTTARKNGSMVGREQIDEKTVFVSALAKHMVNRKIQELQIDRMGVCKLYIKAHKMKCKPLIKAFASVIADHICKEHKFVHAPVSIKEFLAQMAGFEKISVKYQRQIHKYVYFNVYGIHEYTIADWIGLHGQPEVLDGHLYLNGQHVTSLEGMELVENPEEITEIDLSDNEIFDSGVNVYSPETSFVRFSNLKALFLADNQLVTLPEEIFEKLTDLESLNVAYNRLDDLPKSLFHKLTRLEQLSLNNNAILWLSKKQFWGLTNLQTLDLARNAPEELPSGIFRDQKRIESVSLNYNDFDEEPELPDSKELVFFGWHKNPTKEQRINSFIRYRKPIPIKEKQEVSIEERQEEEKK